MVGPVCVDLWVILGEEWVLFVLGGGVWQSAGDIRGGMGVICVGGGGYGSRRVILGEERVLLPSMHFQVICVMGVRQVPDSDTQ